jgi:hypothetical protein
VGSGVETTQAFEALLQARAAALSVSDHTSFLFPVPSILYGFARALDLGAQLDSYNVTITPAQADSLALANDWLAASRQVSEAAIANLTEYLREYLETEDGQATVRKALDEIRERLDAMTAAR